MDEILKITLENAKMLGTDLVEASYHRGCCAECAKYRKRWFSISGNDKRFPKMPIDYGCTCEGITFDPVIYGISEPTYSDEIDDIIAYSNRPFVDDRTKDELLIYSISRKNEENEKMWAAYEPKWALISQYDNQQYERLVAEMPSIAPKSFSGYMRMKKNNTDNFQKIRIKAKENGIELDYPADIQSIIAELTPIREQYLSTKAEYNDFYLKSRQCCD